MKNLIHFGLPEVLGFGFDQIFGDPLPRGCGF